MEQGFGQNQVLRISFRAAVAHQHILNSRINRQDHVGDQGPGCGGPGQEERVIGLIQLKFQHTLTGPAPLCSRG